MNPDQVSFLTFGVLLLLALLFDLGLINRSRSRMTMRKAIYQTLFWVVLSLGFCAFLWFEKSALTATKFFTAYLMEWSLSVDNIFVFIIIFTYFNVEETDAGRALLVGIILAILFRIAFIALGIGLIERFHWILYVFGAFLLYTGYKLFFQNDEAEFNPGDTRVYRFMKKYLRLLEVEPKGRYMVIHHGKAYFTTLSVVVVMLAAVDLAFALDSIPTVVSLVRDDARSPFTDDDRLIIYSSNIFAILGLRSLFFLLRGAVDQFDYLQQGIAVVLAFIGVKMLVEYFGIRIDILSSLAVIVTCLGASVLYSIYHRRKRAVRNIIEEDA
ncbi:MAG: TerC/Alx family metal homeostasis membrane protein [Bacteroidetes bacterium]|nr:TerC/Alx family metal homeostasis membrane protein [Bacteroidota bacterium]